MKILRFLVVVAAMLAGLSGIAKADPVDYKIGGLDPLSGPGFAVVVPGEPFPLTFTEGVCDFFSIKNADGCFFGFNASSKTLTTLDIVVPNNSVLAGQPVDCITGGLFSGASCSAPTPGSDTGEYVLDFSGGTIGAWDYFIIFEDGVAAADFPASTAVADPVPEPSSLWLALSGTGALGYLVRRRRRILS